MKPRTWTCASINHFIAAMNKTLLVTPFIAAPLTLGLAAKVLGAEITPPPITEPHQIAILEAARAPLPAPQIQGALRVGIRPGTPFLYAIAATGERPMTFAARALPSGLRLDLKTGIITGRLDKPGEHIVRVRAANALGNTEAKLTIVCGDTIALTPPMGWNSYDAFGDAVVESEVLQNAAWLKQHLQPVGYDTVVVDFRWYDALASADRPQLPEGVTIDEHGLPAPPTNRFPSAAGGQGFKPLADQVHAMGVKFGVHLMRGIPRKTVALDLPIPGSNFRASEAVYPTNHRDRVCAWGNRDMWGVDASKPAGKAWYAALYRQLAAWSVDYVKVDDMMGRSGYCAHEVEAVEQSIRASGRSMVFSLSPGQMPLSRARHLEANANLWRVSGDFWDNWRALTNNFQLLSAWALQTGPGHWPDGDMIPFGHICIRNCDVKPERWTRFKPDEQLTLMSLWALTSSPLMLGMNLPDNDEWTTAIISNPEVLVVNQDPLGRPAFRATGNPWRSEMWTKSLADGSVAVGLFNRRDTAEDLTAVWYDLGLGNQPRVRDLWLHKDLGPQDRFQTTVPPHGCVLVRVLP